MLLFPFAVYLLTHLLLPEFFGRQDRKTTAEKIDGGNDERSMRFCAPFG
jgi:hypothetical protein